MIYTTRNDADLPIESFSLVAPTPYGEMRLPASCKVITPAVVNTGMWAPEECMLVQTLLREGDTMLDVGAHCGFLTLAGAHQVGPTGKVISVEPTPQTATILRDNIARLSPAASQVIEAAAWSESGKATMSVSADNTGDNRAYQIAGQGHVSEVEIDRVALGEVLSDLDRLDLVKMDTQGCEPFAIAGMWGLIEKFRPVMIMEFWPPGIRQAGGDPKQLLGMIRSLGYEIRVPGAIGFGSAPDEIIEQVAAGTPGEHISILAVPRSASVVDLVKSEARVFSQNGEDGVIAELIRRVGAPGRFFVEFGAERGEEGNCAFLAGQGFSGLLIEGDPDSYAALHERYRDNDQVTTLNSMVTADNLQQLLEDASVPSEPDVFSIDIDSNDFYVWQSLTAFSPRIMVVEYNAQMGSERQVVMPRNDSHEWDGTDYYGASVAALRKLGEEKGYTLVHTDSCGVNAFFVRDDLMEGSGLPSGDAVPLHPANHFHTGKGHPRDPQDRPWVDLESGQEVRLGTEAL